MQLGDNTPIRHECRDFRDGRGRELGSWTSDVGSGDNPVWAVGVTVSFPLGNRQERASYQTARLQAEQLLLQLKQVEQQIVIAVDNAAGHAARSAEIRARADYNESLVALDQAEGTTLRKHNITLQE